MTLDVYLLDPGISITRAPDVQLIDDTFVTYDVYDPQLT